MEIVNVTIDFVTREKDGSFRVVLVEGPWDPPESKSELNRCARRLADAATAVLTGQLSSRYPEMGGNLVTIQLDSYDTPKTEVDAIVHQIHENLLASAEIRDKLGRGDPVTDLRFVHNWFDWNAEWERRNGPKQKASPLARIIAWFRGA